VTLLQQYNDMFAFGPKEMAGIYQAVMEHRSSVGLIYKPIAQKKRYMEVE